MKLGFQSRVLVKNHKKKGRKGERERERREGRGEGKGSPSLYSRKGS
jgi:hypothetical protein